MTSDCRALRSPGARLAGALWAEYWLAAPEWNAARKRKIQGLITSVEHQLSHAACYGVR